MSHFESKRAWKTPTYTDLVELYEKRAREMKGTGKTSSEIILEEMFGTGSSLIKQSAGDKGWKTGQGLGSTAQGPNSFTIQGLLSTTSTPEFLQAIIGTTSKRKDRDEWEYEHKFTAEQKKLRLDTWQSGGVIKPQ